MLARLDACEADPELWTGPRLPGRRPEGPDPHAQTVASRLSDHLDRADRRLRDVEVRRAEAEARAAGERRRRRLILALAGTLALAASLGFGLPEPATAAGGVLEQAHGARPLSMTVPVAPVATCPSGANSEARCELTVLVERGPGRSPTARRAADLLERFRLDDAALEWLERIQLGQGGFRMASSMIPASRTNTSGSSVPTGSRSARPPRRIPRGRLRHGAILFPLCGVLDEWATLTADPCDRASWQGGGPRIPIPFRNGSGGAVPSGADPAPLAAMAAYARRPLDDARDRAAPRPRPDPLRR